jgi:hypothetical protein
MPMFIPEKNSVIRRIASRIAMRLLSTRRRPRQERVIRRMGGSLLYILNENSSRRENAAAGKCVHIKTAACTCAADKWALAISSA